MRPHNELEYSAVRHPLWKKWLEMHKTRVLLLGGIVEGFGSISYSYTVKSGKVLDPDTMEETEWSSDAYDEGKGYKKFFRWVQEQEYGAD